MLQGRFTVIVVDRDSYLIELCRYAVLNPRARTTPQTRDLFLVGLPRHGGTLSYHYRSDRGTMVAVSVWPPARGAQSKYQTFVAAGIGQRMP